MNITRLIFNLDNLGYDINLSGNNIIVYKENKMLVLINEDGAVYDDNFYLLTENQKEEESKESLVNGACEC